SGIGKQGPGRLTPALGARASPTRGDEIRTGAQAVHAMATDEKTKTALGTEDTLFTDRGLPGNRCERPPTDVEPQLRAEYRGRPKPCDRVSGCTSWDVARRDFVRHTSWREQRMGALVDAAGDRQGMQSPEKHDPSITPGHARFRGDSR